ncbi:MAG: redox-sensitive bicupin YhaK (pirin superfamily), partial [Myxococcota bacterium]
MKVAIRRSAERGGADHGWLNTQHTFSFANYHAPEFMGFGPLRVINQDRVESGRGFGTHGHRNMEIISYVVEGALEHRDSLGTGSVIRPGEVQLMSAGTGVRHSEMNGSTHNPVHFLQIWIVPAEDNTEPRYEQKFFPPTEDDGVRLVASHDGRDGSVTMGQNADLYRVLLPAEAKVTQSVSRLRSWVQVVTGTVTVNGVL